VIIPLNSVKNLIFVMVVCRFIHDMESILKYYLKKLRFQRVNKSTDEPMCVTNSNYEKARQRYSAYEVHICNFLKNSRHT
jgi:hypothetical protein